MVPLALPLLLGPGGCHRPVPSICRQTCECKPCTDADVEACITKTETTLEAVTDCDEQLDAYLACYDDNLSCQNGAGVGTTACNAEEAKLIACSGIGNPFLNACERAMAKNAMCTGSSSPPPSDNCPKTSECFARCQLDTSCDVLVNGAFSEEFNACIDACSKKSGGGMGGAGGGGVGGAGGKF